jgi:hypothetical protein
MFGSASFVFLMMIVTQQFVGSAVARASSLNRADPPAGISGSARREHLISTQHELNPETIRASSMPVARENINKVHYGIGSSARLSSNDDVRSSSMSRTNLGSVRQQQQTGGNQHVLKPLFDQWPFHGEPKTTSSTTETPNPSPVTSAPRTTTTVANQLDKKFTSSLAKPGTHSEIECS